MVIISPFLCFLSVIGFGILALAGNGIDALPAASLRRVELALLFL